MFITIIAFNKFHGSKPLKLNGIVKLVKEPDNKYDAEAIACEMRYFGKIGYVANSDYTKYELTSSASELKDKIPDAARGEYLLFMDRYADIHFLVGRIIR